MPEYIMELIERIEKLSETYAVNMYNKRIMEAATAKHQAMVLKLEIIELGRRYSGYDWLGAGPEEPPITIEFSL